MAKRKKVLPARKPRDRSRDDESLLMRSAESLGRMIGTLQRQLDGATKSVKRATGAGKTTATRKRTARKATPTRKRTARKSTKKR
jgi:hypothetical protein